MINWQENSWRRTTLLTDRAVRLSTAKASVLSDSVLCMGRISENHVKAWKEKIDWFMNSSQRREWIESTEKPMEFEWNIFPKILCNSDSHRDPEHDDCFSMCS